MSEKNTELWQDRLYVLLEETKNGNHDAATELINHYNKKIFFIARSYTGSEDDAKDIVQNVWIKALRSISNLEDNEKFEAWISMITRNESLSYVTSASQKKNIMFSDLDNEDDGLMYDVEDERINSRPDLQYSDTARREIIQEILNTLPEGQRVVTVLHFYDQMSAKEIAEQLGVPMSTITGRLQHAKEAIRAAVSDLQKRDGIKLYEMTPLTFFIYLMQIETTAGWLPATSRILSVATPAIGASAAEIASALQAGSAVTTATASTASAAGTAVSSTAATVNSAAGSAVSATAESTTAAMTTNAITETAVISEAAAEAGVTTGAAVAGTGASEALAAPVAIKTGITAGKIIGTVAAVGVAGAGAVVIPQVVEQLQAPKDVNVMEFAQVSFHGFNGQGTGSIQFADTGDEKLNELLATGTCTFAEDGTFLNGIPTRVACTFDTETAEKEGYIINNTEGMYMVDGLTSITSIDLFEDVSVEWVTDDEEHTAEMVLNAPMDDPYGVEAQYVIIQQDDNGNAIVHAYVSNEKMSEKGFEAAGGIYDRKYSLGRIPDTYRDLRKSCVAGGGIWDGAEHSCMERQVEAVQAETQPTAPAQTDNSDIMALARAYVGRTGLCDEIAWQFIWDLYGVDITWYKNVYDVSDLQPGDLVHYYDDTGRARHVSVYLGNGLVLAGNYLDGTAHIVGINQSYYNQKSYQRVSR